MTGIISTTAILCQAAGRRLRILSLLLCLAPGAVPAVQASPAIQSPASIVATVQGYLQGRFGDSADTRFEIGALDPRLRLTACRRSLRAALPENGRQLGHSSVIVRCPEPDGWKIRVSVRIQRFVQVLTARRALPRGTYLQADDVQFERREVSRLNHGYFRQFEEIREMVTKRNVRRGQVLTAASVSPPRLVQRGEAVTILARSGGLAIRVKGEALMDGRRGDRVRVRNSRSKRELQATVIAAGTVAVNM